MTPSLEHEGSLLDVKDVARRFNVPCSWVYAKAEAGELPHLKIGRYLRFNAADIERYLLDQQRGASTR